MNYHDDTTALTRSQLALFLASRVEYYETFVTRQMPQKSYSKAVDDGSLIHAVLLDGGNFDDMVAIYPPSLLKSNGDLKNGAKDSLQADNPGKICRKEKEIAPLRACVDAALSGELGDVIRAATDTEKTIEAEIEGRLCKCRPDIICDMGHSVVIYDLKCGDADAGLFRRNARRLKYWLQDAHYSAIAEAIYDKPVTFRFMRLETSYPFRLMPYWYEPVSRNNAREAHTIALRQFVECEQSGVWEDEHDPILVMDHWEAGEQLEEFNG